MTLIKSLSGIRGTIGGALGEGLTPLDVMFCIAVYATLLSQQGGARDKLRVVIGRDARPSGVMMEHIALGCLQSLGIDVINCGLSPTPSIAMAVKNLKADGGIILTASHNPLNWNALKFLNAEGEILDPAQGEELLSTLKIPLAEFLNTLVFAPADELGSVIDEDDSVSKHIEAILALELVRPDLIRQKDFTVVIDAVNSVGNIALPLLLKALGVSKIYTINEDVSGLFSHDPEPLPKNLGDLAQAVELHTADLGIAVDPDVDRLALVAANGAFVGEEYTLVLVADYVLSNTPGPSVSNISSSLALRDVTNRYNAKHYYAKVGEACVVRAMKETGAVIGGEGNGGVIYPDLHYGRDALVGIALVLSHMALSNKSLWELRQSYPSYVIVKEKLPLKVKLDFERVEAAFLASVQEPVSVSRIDGLRIDFVESNKWVQLRLSGTEPVARIYAEAPTEQLALALLSLFKKAL